MNSYLKRMTLCVLGVVILQGCADDPQANLSNIGKEKINNTRNIVLSPTQSALRDSMQVSTKSIKKEDPLSLNFTYPYFSTNDVDIEALNKVLQRFLLDGFQEDKNSKDINVETVINNFVNSYSEGNEDIEDLAMHEYNIDGELLLNTKGFISLQKTNYEFAGGAHPNSYVDFLNWDVKAQKEISLKDLLIPGFQSKLLTIAEKKFKKDLGLAANASMELVDEKGYEFGGKFKLAEHYGFTKEGIIFFYNAYEIAPYSMGPVELFVSYKDIRSLIKAESLLAIIQ